MLPMELLQNPSSLDKELAFFTGRSLNEVYGDTLKYNISSNTWANIHTVDRPVSLILIVFIS